MTRDSAGTCLRLAHPHVGDRSSYRFLTVAFLARFQRKPPRRDRSSSRSSLRGTETRSTWRAAAWATSTAQPTRSSGARWRSRCWPTGTPTTNPCRERFKREALAAARLSGSPNTVTIFDVGESDGHPYIVMELLEGGTLEDRLKAGGAQDPADVIRWLDQAAGALDAAHAAGVVHRDVKPGNLLLNSRGEVAVADFGVASAVGLDSMTMTGTVLGTAGYLSPEQAKGERATPASDRYALGVVAYELLTGERPFASDSATAEASAHVHAPIPYPSQHGDVPPELDPVLRRALAKDPAERYRELGRLRRGAARGAVARGRHDARARGRPGGASTRPSRRRRKRAEPARVGGRRDPRGCWRSARASAWPGVLGDDEEPQTRTVIETQVTTEAGQPTTVRETVTTAPATTSEPTTTAAPPTTAPSDATGEELTDQATALLGQGRWAEAEAVARQALAKLEGSGELYEAYALLQPRPRARRTGTLRRGTSSISIARSRSRAAGRRFARRASAAPNEGLSLGRGCLRHRVREESVTFRPRGAAVTRPFAILCRRRADGGCPLRTTHSVSCPWSATA